jgi:hypothetical protein
MPRAALIFRVDMDLKFCTIADNDPGWVPFGRRCRGEASVVPFHVSEERPESDASPLPWITMIPWMWFGIMIPSSNTTRGKWCGISS